MTGTFSQHNTVLARIVSAGGAVRLVRRQHSIYHAYLAVSIEDAPMVTRPHPASDELLMGDFVEELPEGWTVML